MTAADALRSLIFGDASMAMWASDESSPGEPWASFAHARALAETGDLDGARELWRRIAALNDVESRHVIQAWHFLRGAGEVAPAAVAAVVLGVVAQVPVDDGEDVLAAYADGGVRYLNHAGGVVVVDPPTTSDLTASVADWLNVANKLSGVIGPWEGPLPEVPRGHARVLMLTPSGPRFGQGPYDSLAADPAAGAFLGAATSVLQLVVRKVS